MPFHHLAAIVSLVVVLVGCAGTPGKVKATSGSPLFSITAGSLQYSPGTNVAYVIDTATWTCWFTGPEVGGAIDCCALYRGVAQSRPLLSWLSDATCVDAASGAREPSPEAVSVPASRPEPAPAQ